MSSFSSIPARSAPLPVETSERAAILDVLRGFAILGILLDNLFAFTGFGFMSEPQMKALPTWPADGVLAFFELTLVHGKFYSLFSLLFGIGFSIILLRNEARGVNPMKIFYRRLLVLLLFGALHLFFVWPGDILFLYAALGFLLPLFRNCSGRTLLFLAGALIFSPLLIDGVKVLLGIRTGTFLENIGLAIDKKNGLPVNVFPIEYMFGKKAGWPEFWTLQQTGFFYRYSYIIESNRIVKVLGMFVLGLYVGRRLLYARLEENTPLLRRLRRWGFLIGVPASLAMAYFEIDSRSVPAPAGLLDTVFYTLGVVPLSIAYTSSICLYWVRTNGKNYWQALAPVGRMALTNYLAHTFICIALFYGVGFGLGGHIGPVVFFPIALIIFALQIGYSRWWFQRFEYGPLEWVWRQLTYSKRLPLRKRKRPTANFDETSLIVEKPV